MFVNGHSLTMRFLERDDQARQTHGINPSNREMFEDYYRGTLDEAERRLGALRARKLQLGNHSLFPNGVLGFRLAHPRGPLETEFWHFVLYEKDMPRELKTALRRGSANYNGVTGVFEQDDMDNWRGVTQSGLEQGGATVPAGPFDGSGTRRTASRPAGYGVGAVHVGKQPAELLPAVAAVHECR